MSKRWSLATTCGSFESAQRSELISNTGSSSIESCFKTRASGLARGRGFSRIGHSDSALDGARPPYTLAYHFVPTHLAIFLSGNREKFLTLPIVDICIVQRPARRWAWRGLRPSRAGPTRPAGSAAAASAPCPLAPHHSSCCGSRRHLLPHPSHHRRASNQARMAATSCGTLYTWLALVASRRGLLAVQMWKPWVPSLVHLRQWSLQSWVIQGIKKHEKKVVSKAV